ncbi:hypothetical protein EHQ53_05830 [Leptospira langatensis]|uniref:Uncharacterized protein n=1 Tax=Leptospira langatensis TaxID=2484983 RepID=A0A5F1ZV67_9LEPT|nr:hypothetical protein [Leptospira langatensis]TGK02983.1 hypothetical protein EHO57_06665 [Leptospira langatensis]TGL41738.1 hypothetical protein EHQ53_05830 [Leptospira langatensis]
MEEKNREKLDQEIFRRLESYEWSDNISARIIEQRRRTKVRRLFALSLGSLFIGILSVASFYVQPERGDQGTGEWQGWVEEQIEGTFEDAETSMQTPDLSQEDPPNATIPSSSLMDVDTLIETSFERR